MSLAIIILTGIHSGPSALLILQTTLSGSERVNLIVNPVAVVACKIKACTHSMAKLKTGSATSQQCYERSEQKTMSD